MKKELKRLQTFEQPTDKNLNISGVSGSTRLKLKKEWKTPYNHFQIGDNSELQYFAQKLGKTTEQLIKDFENGSLDSWFEIMYYL
jgi:hypothetical protein